MNRPLTLLLGLTLAFCVTQVAADATVGRASSDVIRDRVLDLVNRARSEDRRCGSERFHATQPLELSPKLTQAALGHASDMLRHHYFEHEGRDGSTPKERLARAGYRSRLTGENIAFGPVSAEEVVDGWLASPGHCENIMEPRFREMGLAYARKGKRTYWVLDLALPR